MGPGCAFIEKGTLLATELGHDLAHFLAACRSGHGGDLEPVFLSPNDIQSLSANTPRAAKYSDAFQVIILAGLVGRVDDWMQGSGSADRIEHQASSGVLNFRESCPGWRRTLLKLKVV